MGNKKLILSLIFGICLIFLIGIASAADFAYVVKNSLSIDSNLITRINDLGFSVDTVFEGNIQSTDFNDYRMIIVGDSNLDDPSIIPQEDYKTLIINSFDYYKKSSADYQLGWSLEIGSKTSPSILNVANPSHPITEGVSVTFNAYTISDPFVKTFYLKGQKPTGIDLVIGSNSIDSDTVVGALDQGAILLNGKTLNERPVYIGAVKAQYWTNNLSKEFIFYPKRE